MQPNRTIGAKGYGVDWCKQHNKCAIRVRIVEMKRPTGHGYKKQVSGGSNRFRFDMICGGISEGYCYQHPKSLKRNRNYSRMVYVYTTYAPQMHHLEQVRDVTVSGNSGGCQ